VSKSKRIRWREHVSRKEEMRNVSRNEEMRNVSRKEEMRNMKRSHHLGEIGIGGRIILI
jgi:hypothetical protein